MIRRLVEVEQLDPDGFTPEGFRSWAKANSIGHHIAQSAPIFIVDGLWIYALTMPLRSWPTDPSIPRQLTPGCWAMPPWGDREAAASRWRWRWYLLRTRPEAHGYIDPALADPQRTDREGEK